MSAPTVPDTDQAAAFGLRWGIKRSFVDYVRRMPDGKGWVGDGALPVGTHEVLYGSDVAGRRTAADGAEERFWAFRGDVRFSGHAGMLAVRLAAPVLTLRDGAGDLTVAGFGDERLTLVTLRLTAQPAPEGTQLWHGEDVRLTEAGTELFNEVYAPGEPFEQMTLVLPADG